MVLSDTEWAVLVDEDSQSATYTRSDIRVRRNSDENIFHYFCWGVIICFSSTGSVPMAQTSFMIDFLAWGWAMECNEMVVFRSACPDLFRSIFWFNRPWGYLELRIDENYSHRKYAGRRETDDRCWLTDNNWSLFLRGVTEAEKIVVRITGMGSGDWLGVMKRETQPLQLKQV